MKTTKPFWHRLSKKEHEKVLKSGITVKQALKRYRQPTWCAYHEALAGIMGCWVLTGDSRLKISHKFCEHCDVYINKS